MSSNNSTDYEPKYLPNGNRIYDEDNPNPLPTDVLVADIPLSQIHSICLATPLAGIQNGVPLPLTSKSTIIQGFSQLQSRVVELETKPQDPGIKENADKIEAQATTLQAMADADSKVEQRVSTLESAVGPLADRVSKAEAAIETANKSSETALANSNVALGKISVIEGQYSDIQNVKGDVAINTDSIDKITTRLTAVETAASANTANVENAKEAAAEAKSLADANAKDLSEVKPGLSSAKTDISDLKKLADSNKESSDQAADDIVAIKKKLADLEASASGVFESIPNAFAGQVVTVTKPNIRQFIWNGTKYVRAPWNQPGMLKYSYINHDSMIGYIKVDSTVNLSSADYPELAEMLKVEGDTFKLIDFNGQFIRVLNTTGVGLDANRAVLTPQDDCIRNITGKIPSVHHVTDAPPDSDAFTSGAFASCENIGEYGKTPDVNSGASSCWDHMFDASNADGVKVGPENRPSNIALSLWISY